VSRVFVSRATPASVSHACCCCFRFTTGLVFDSYTIQWPLYVIYLWYLHERPAMQACFLWRNKTACLRFSQAGALFDIIKNQHCGE